MFLPHNPWGGENQVLSTFRQSGTEWVLASCSAASLEKACNVVQPQSMACQGSEGGAEVGHRDELVLLVPAESGGKLAKKGGCHMPRCSLQGHQVWVVRFDRLQLVHQACICMHRLTGVYGLMVEVSVLHLQTPGHVGSGPRHVQL